MKPISADLHFKYICPECEQEHWLSLQESKTPNFKIVCYCTKVLEPTTISKIDINIVYANIDYHKSIRRALLDLGYSEAQFAQALLSTPTHLSKEDALKSILSKI